MSPEPYQIFELQLNPKLSLLGLCHFDYSAKEITESKESTDRAESSRPLVYSLLIVPPVPPRAATFSRPELGGAVFLDDPGAIFTTLPKEVNVDPLE